MMQVIFILVEPAVPENIGAAARAMNTMGFDQLRLVNPVSHLGDKARMLAHGSQQLLERAGLYNDLNEAITDIDFVIGTSAKIRSVKQDYIKAEELPAAILKKSNAIKSIAIVFGREESGLTNDEIQLCDVVSYFKLKQPYPSLNLGQAVMLYAYLLREFGFVNTVAQAPETIHPESYKNLKNKVSNLLETIGFEPGGTIYNRIMERLAMISGEDVNLLHSIEKKLGRIVHREENGR